MALLWEVIVEAIVRLVRVTSVSGIDVIVSLGIGIVLFGSRQQLAFLLYGVMMACIP